MLFFKRIFNSSTEPGSHREKRLRARHSVGADFPVKARVALIGRDPDGHLLSQDLAKSRDWGGRILNLSGGGANLGIAVAALAARGEPSRLQLRLGEDFLDLPATIAHFRIYRDYANLGLKFDALEPTVEKAYLQLLEPVAMGASLTPVAPAKVRQDTPGMTKEEYSGGPRSRLIIWRNEIGGAIGGMDFHLGDYAVRWAHDMPELATVRLRPTGSRHLSEAEQTEVRWLFGLTVPNLPRSVPADLRKFLGGLVA